MSSTENKKYAKNLTVGDWIRTAEGVYIVRNVADYGNGNVRVDLSDGRSIDCLGYRSFPLA